MRCFAGTVFCLLLAMPAAAQTPDHSLLPGKLYDVDNAHSLLDFTVRHVGFSRVRGRFQKYSAAIYYVESDLTRSSIILLIDATSIDTGEKTRDKDLRSKEFFDTEQFPRIVFQSHTIEQRGDTYAAAGSLTMRGVTREVQIPFRISSPKGVDQFDNMRISFEGRLTLNRKDYGVNGPRFWNELIADNVEIEFDLAAREFNYLNRFSRWADNSIGKVVLERIEQQGANAARRDVMRLWETDKDTYDFGLLQFFKAGMQLVQRGKLKDAVEVFELGIDLRADSEKQPTLLSNVYSALGETYARLGNRSSAVSNVEKAVALDAMNAEAAELKRILGR